MYFGISSFVLDGNIQTKMRQFACWLHHQSQLMSFKLGHAQLLPIRGLVWPEATKIGFEDSPKNLHSREK